MTLMDRMWVTDVAKFPPSLDYSDSSSHEPSRRNNSFFLMFQLPRSVPGSTLKEGMIVSLQVQDCNLRPRWSIHLVGEGVVVRNFSCFGTYELHAS